MSVIVDTVSPVVVVGAGLAGLSAAAALADAGVRDILVLEARDRVGGRTLTRREWLRGECAVAHDVGAQWIGPRHARLLELARRFEVKTLKQEWIEGFGLTVPEGVEGRLGWLEWIASDACSLQETMDGWGVGLIMTEADREDLVRFTRTFLACEPREVSAAYLCWSARTCGGVRYVSDGPDGAQSMMLEGGFFAFSVVTPYA